jgi:pyruvate-formate lyase
MSDFSYEARIRALRSVKLAETREKQRVLGAMNYDDWSLLLPPEEERELTRVTSPSGIPITDCRLKSFRPESNHPSGGFYGAEAVGRNFRRLLDLHPLCITPPSSLAGGYVTNFASYRSPHWNPDLSYAHLAEDHERYALGHGIGAMQHFCQDLAIGLRDGWGTILRRIRYFRGEHPGDAEKRSFHDGLEHVVLGIQGWIARHAAEARRLAQAATDGGLRRNYDEMAGINERLVDSPPATFREALQWILWYQLAARMYNGSGSLGRIDVLLEPFYEAERREGRLDDEEAVFHLACLLFRDTGYSQLGGPDEEGRDVTSRVSYLVLEAAHRLRIPANIGVCVGEGVDPGLLRRGVEIMLEDRAGIPKFLGIDNTTRGFARNGCSLETARMRAYSGCHWSAIPGREYTVNDCVKVNFAKVFQVAFGDMMASTSVRPSSSELWTRFAGHLRRAVLAISRGLAFHLEHMHEVFPELVLDLLCHGPIERGLDASHGGVELCNLCVDGSALATVADSFAAIRQRVEEEEKLSFPELDAHLRANWAGPGGERARAMMKSSRRFGFGGCHGDEYAGRISRVFAECVKAAPVPAGVTLIPGLFSWAAMIDMGLPVGATPNGRRAGDPISHGPNPDPGFRKDAAPTALASAVAAVQCGWGNTAPLQLEIDPVLARADAGPRYVQDLIRTHFSLGGTQINMNVIDRQTLLAAHRDPSKYPDLVVRVTGFSAYFASLSPEFRELVVARALAGEPRGD